MGSLAVFAKYKIVFVVLTVVLLGVAYYLIYYKSKASRLNKVVFWASVILVILMQLYVNRYSFLWLFS